MPTQIITNYERGSEWRKWDLQVHTPFTKLNDGFEININDNLNSAEVNDKKWEIYFNKLDEANLSVVGITDYFSIENYKILCEIKNNLE